jgi:hypothetical protein
VLAKISFNWRIKELCYGYSLLHPAMTVCIRSAALLMAWQLTEGSLDSTTKQKKGFGTMVNPLPA